MENESLFSKETFSTISILVGWCAGRNPTSLLVIICCFIVVFLIYTLYPVFIQKHFGFTLCLYTCFAYFFEGG